MAQEPKMELKSNTKMEESTAGKALSAFTSPLAYLLPGNILSHNRLIYDRSETHHHHYNAQQSDLLWSGVVGAVIGFVVCLALVYAVSGVGVIGGIVFCILLGICGTMLWKMIVENRE